MADQPNAAEDTIKGTRHRSPNYPAINLKKAVERAQQLHEKYKRGQVPIDLATSLWGYKPNSSGGVQGVAALKAFGLLEVEGEGKARKLKISDKAFRIIHKSADSQKLLQEAALTPAIHKELWERYRVDGVPDDEIIRHYLLMDRPNGTFNDEAIGSVISAFRASLQYSGLLESDKTTPDDESPDDFPFGSNRTPPPSTLVVGSGVQWTSQGVDQFPAPRRVLGFSDDRQWVFVEGMTTGLPADQLTVVPEMTPKPQTPPPPNPFAGGSNSGSGGKTRDDLAWGVPPLSFPLPRGNVIEIRLKQKVTAEEFKKIKAIIDLSESSFVFDPDYADDLLFNKNG